MTYNKVERIKSILEKYKVWVLNDSWRVPIERFDQDKAAQQIAALDKLPQPEMTEQGCERELDEPMKT